MSKLHGLESILSYNEIKARLDKREIFRPGSWDPANIRSAAYDLRMADDLLVIPDPPVYTSGRRYKRGERRTKEVILNPGDVAFISTVERLCIPWDLSGTLGPKFSLTARGILILTGIFVDPGYGLFKLENGEWTPMDDQRLHFLLANVGSDSVVFIPGKQRIAAIQFSRVSEPTDKGEIPSVGFQGIEHDFFDTKAGHEAGLVFFRNMADIRSEVGDFRQSISQYDQRIAQFNQRLSSVESGSNQILMFGVYLLCATILGVSIAVILSLISNLKVEISWPSALVLSAGFITLGWIVRSFLKYLHPIIIANPKQSKSSEQPKKGAGD